MKLVHSVPCEIRLGQQTDKSFILDSWLKAHKKSHTHRDVPDEIYYHHQEPIIHSLLSQSFVIVACSPQDPDQILGYCIAQPSAGGVCVIHWINVKQVYRKLGIGSVLVAEAKKRCNAKSNIPVVMTHISQAFKWLEQKWDLAYSPYIIAMEIQEYDPCEIEIN